MMVYNPVTQEDADKVRALVRRLDEGVTRPA
jgi:hypothetical protein